ncbi:regulator of chromosome condensation-like [Ctenocephalides felis]|uniref:regulator of chromosome condensation-like n=1 Tax=Ctenocephalides felis TaxID=7515 RepID=UPI000E6E20B1|nr:regulator of chromosome condensation-like [Ctenocephalides felis]
MGGNGELGTGSDDDVLAPVQVTGKHINGKKVLQLVVVENIQFSLLNNIFKNFANFN